MRITQADRLLLALEGGGMAASAYEMERRFSQPGLSELLGMEQSQVSRTAKRLLSQRLIDKEKRRVVGESRRVLVYLPTEKGISNQQELRQRVLEHEVLSTGDDGLLKRQLLQELLATWDGPAGASGHSALEIADILRSAPHRDGIPLIEHDSAMASIERPESPKDLASETIGYLLQLAGVERDRGQSSDATEHLSRAAQLYRQKGDAAGETTCLLASGSLSGQFDSARLSALAAVIEADEIDPSWWQTMTTALPEARRKSWLQALWRTRPGLPIAGHIGFALIDLGEPLHDELESLFSKVDDQAGLKAVRASREQAG